MFGFSTPVSCEQKGDEMRLACQPVYLIAHQLIVGLELTSGATWVRACFRNGAHRWALAQAFPQNARGVLVERIQDFDECVRVGNVVAFTDWDPENPDAVGPTVALARLASIRLGLVHEGASYSIQHWQTLSIFGGARG